ncbi:MAG: sensor histidine kinase [Actinomycetota bacterium]
MTRIARISRALGGSIRRRLIGGVVVLHVVLMGLVVADMLGRQQRFMEAQLSAEARGLADNLSLNSMQWLLTNDLNGLGELVGNLKAQGNLRLALVLNAEGRVLASSDPALFNLTLTDEPSRHLFATLDEGGDSQLWHDGTVDSLSAVLVGGRRIGYARVILDTAPVQAELQAVVGKGAAYTVAAIVLGALLAWLLVRSMTGRLALLSAAMDRMAAGEPEVALPDDRGVDEVSRLTRDFNHMAVALAAEKAEHVRLLQRLDRANGELMRLAEISAHHLQEPVRRLVTYSQLLRSTVGSDADPSVEKALNQMDRDGRHLRELLRDIEVYLSADQPRTAEPWADANRAVATALRRLAAEIELSHARIETQTLPDAAIDPARLAEIFGVLLENALRYRHTDMEPHIVVAAETADGVVTFRVVDNGIGIPPDKRERAFQVFERLGPAPLVGGTGIGLAIVRRMVESRGGRAWLDEAAGGGTVAAFTLPAT